MTFVFNHGKDIEDDTCLTLFKEIDAFQPYRIISGSHHLVQMSQFNVENLNLNLSSVAIVTPMGSTVPLNLFSDLKKFMKNLKFVQQIYGMTEFEVVTHGYDVSTLGTVLPGCQIKIVDPDSGEICGPNQV